MSVDWYPCKRCGKTFNCCGDYTSCEGCGTMWCSDKCAKKDGHVYEEDEDRGIIEETESCNFCRNEDFEDGELLEFVCKKYNETRETLVQEYKNSM